jgi:hypothetical protein
VVRADQAVVIHESLIFQVAPDATLPSLPGDWVIDAQARLLAPALSDCAAVFSKDPAQRSLELANRIREGVTFLVGRDAPISSATLGARVASQTQLTAAAVLEKLLVTPLPEGGRIDEREFSALLMGTRGQGSMLEHAFVLEREAQRLSQLNPDFDGAGALFQVLHENPGALKSRIWGPPSGAVIQGSLADVVLYDFVPPLHRRVGLLEVLRSRVAWVVVDGNVLVREGELLGASYLELARAAQLALSQPSHV